MAVEVGSILGKLRKVRKSAEGAWVACCPAHEDANPSLSIKQSGDKILLHCFAGCEVEAICGALGIEQSELFSDDGRRVVKFPEAGVTVAALAAKFGIAEEVLRGLGLKEKGKAVAVPYLSEEGTLIHEKLRVALSGSDKYRYPRGATAAIYGLWRLREARAKKALVIVEGESDCWTLWRSQVAAVGVPGASAFSLLREGHIAGVERIWIVEEADEAGKQFARNVALHLRDIGHQGSMKVVRCSRYGVKDVNEMALRAGNVAEFEAVFRQACKEAPEWTRETIETSLVKASSIMPRQPSFLWFPYLPDGMLTLLFGKSGVGKSFLTAEIAAAISRGRSLPGDTAAPPAKVIMVAAEDSLDMGVVRRLIGCRAELENVLVWNLDRTPLQFDKGGHDLLWQAIEAHQPRLVILDPLAYFIGGDLDMNRQNQVREKLQPLVSLGQKTGASILLVHHQKKGGGSAAVDAAVGSMDFMAIVRSSLIASPHPEVPAGCVVAHAKSSYHRRGSSWSFEIRDEEYPRLEWGRELMISADGLAAQIGASDAKEDKESLEEAQAFLRHLLASGEVGSEEATDAARRQGITSGWLHRARRALGVSTRRYGEGAQVAVAWSLPGLEMKRASVPPPEDPMAAVAEGVDDELLADVPPV